jgi:eukaryotic-like serine/threonine-protein kinase
MPARAPSLPLFTGEVVAGKYRVERVLGTGGMGVVFAAEHEQLHRKVALKVVSTTITEARDKDLLARFAREAEVAASIRSEHAVKVFDVGHTERGAPFIVLELLEGEDLGEKVERDGPLSPEEAVEYVTEACDAIGEAHALGIIHRDLKPGNLFLHTRPNGERTIKVLDFGISKLTDPDRSKLTTAVDLLGSPVYMSPEQFTDPSTVTSRADLWALGVTLYELLTGATPFVGRSLGETCTLIMTGTAAPMRSIRPELSAALEAVVARCLQKEPTERFATASELVLALKAALVEGVPSSESAAITVPKPNTGESSPSVPPPEPPPEALTVADTLLDFQGPIAPPTPEQMAARAARQKATEAPAAPPSRVLTASALSLLAVAAALLAVTLAVRQIRASAPVVDDFSGAPRAVDAAPPSP